jgi:RimJ/RimL family protein N-acetyltransferase
MEDSSLSIDQDHYLSAVALAGDIDSYLRLMNDDDIYRNTLMIPKPYHVSDAEAFLKLAADKQNKFGHATEFRIREKNGNLCGGISLLGKYGSTSHKDEIGYWLGKPYRRKGLMTRALKLFTEHVMSQYGLVRLEATIFDYNTASQDLVEKCGYKYEGTLKKAYFKDGKYIDAKLFAFVK